MGAVQSDSSDDEFAIPECDRWRHRKCTVRASHQLEIRKEKRDCVYCKIVKRRAQRSKYYCVKCNFTFVLVRRGTISRSGIPHSVTTIGDSPSR